MPLSGKKILVGVGGGIAAYKAVELVRELGRRGAEVRVAMTEAGTRFVGPVTFSGITGHPAVTNLWAADYAGEVHVELGQWADAVVIAPATMNLMARASHGQADDVVLATLACFEGSVFMAPAMHHSMWNQASTKDNVRTLEERGVAMVGPSVGPLASGEVGEGRMAEPLEIADAVEAALIRGQELARVSLLVSAGPTHEDLDPVRFLGNRSSGKMGYAIAERAARRGANVTLVSGPVALEAPRGVQVVQVRSAIEMHEAIFGLQSQMDVIVMAAAVADYRPRRLSLQKLKKGAEKSLELVRNPDILAELGTNRIGMRPILIGFAVETEELEKSARNKLKTKGADLIVANEASAGFGGDTNRAILVDATSSTPLPEMSKPDLAEKILDRIVALLKPAQELLERNPSPDAPN